MTRTESSKEADRKRFIMRFCERSKISVDALLRHCAVLPCDCGIDGCDGWQVVTKKHLELIRELEAKHGE